MIEMCISWSSTALLCSLDLISVSLYVSKGAWTRQALADLGYSAYLVPFIALVKFAGPAVFLRRFGVALSD